MMTSKSQSGTVSSRWSVNITTKRVWADSVEVIDVPPDIATPRFGERPIGWTLVGLFVLVGALRVAVRPVWARAQHQRVFGQISL